MDMYNDVRSILEQYWESCYNNHVANGCGWSDLVVVPSVTDLAHAVCDGTLDMYLTDFLSFWRIKPLPYLTRITAQDVLDSAQPDSPKLEDVVTLVDCLFMSCLDNWN